MPAQSYSIFFWQGRISLSKAALLVCFLTVWLNTVLNILPNFLIPFHDNEIPIYSTFIIALATVTLVLSINGPLYTKLQDITGELARKTNELTRLAKDREELATVIERERRKHESSIIIHKMDAKSRDAMQKLLDDLVANGGVLASQNSLAELKSTLAELKSTMNIPHIQRLQQIQELRKQFPQTGKFISFVAKSHEETRESVEIWKSTEAKVNSERVKEVEKLGEVLDARDNQMMWWVVNAVITSEIKNMLTKGYIQDENMDKDSVVGVKVLSSFLEGLVKTMPIPGTLSQIPFPSSSDAHSKAQSLFKGRFIFQEIDRYIARMEQHFGIGSTGA